MKIYTQAGLNIQNATPENIRSLIESGINLVYGNITQLAISGRKTFGNDGTSLDGIINIPCQNRNVVLRIAPMPSTEAPKHYGPFLEEMGCENFLGLGYDPSVLAARKAEIGVLLDGTNAAAGYITKAGLRELSSAGFTRQP